MTRAQKQHAREQRALLRLRRAAVLYSTTLEDEHDDNDAVYALCALQAACNAYTGSLSRRDRRKLGGPS